MRRSTSKSRDMKNCQCPQCGKKRMTRPLDHEVSDRKQEYTTVRGSKIELYVDICGFCQTRNYQRFFEPTRDDVRRLLSAIHEGAEIQEDQSLEDLL